MSSSMEDTKRIDQGRLEEIAKAHGLWLEGDSRGRRANLSGMDLSGLDLTDLDFSGANAVGTNFAGCDGGRARFGTAKLPDGTSVRTNLADASFARAYLTEADLSGAICLRTNFMSAMLDRASLVDAIFENARCRAASFIGADLDGLRARDCDFAQANMLDAVGEPIEEAGHPNGYEGALLDGTAIKVAPSRTQGAKPAPPAAVAEHRPQEDGRTRLTQEELDAKLELHRLWLRGDEVHGKRLDLSGLDLSGLDLSLRNLSLAILKGADLSRCNLRYANLANAHLEGATIDGADCVGTIFCSAHCQKMSAQGASVAKAHFEQSNQKGANFVGAVGYGARQFLGAVTDNMVLPDGKAKQAGHRIDQGRLEEIAKAHSLWLAGDSRGRRANLSGMDLSGLDLTDLDFSGANAVGTNFAGCDGGRARFGTAKLPDGTSVRTNLADASFARAYLTEADLSGAICLRTNFMSAMLDRASLVDAIFENARCRAASFIGADLDGLRARDCDFAQANMLDAVGEPIEEAGHPNGYEGALLDGTAIEGAPAQAQGAPALDGPQEAQSVRQDAEGQTRKLTQAEVDRMLDETERHDKGDLGARKADFSYCDISGLDLSGRMLNMIDFTGCVAVGAIFDTSTCFRCDFSDADLRRASFFLAQVDEVSFAGADCREAKLAEAYGFDEATIDSGTRLDGAALPKDYLAKVEEESKPSPFAKREAEAPQAAAEDGKQARHNLGNALVAQVPEPIRDAIAHAGYGITAAREGAGEHGEPPLRYVAFSVVPNDAKVGQFVRHELLFRQGEQASAQAWADAVHKASKERNPSIEANLWLDEDGRPQTQAAIERWGESGAGLVQDFAMEAKSFSDLSVALEDLADKEAHPSPLGDSPQAAHEERGARPQGPHMPELAGQEQAI